MDPQRLSASALHCYETCSARFKAEYIDRVPNPSGSAAALGTACHEALELFVSSGCHLPSSGATIKTLHEFYDRAYWKCFSDKSRYDEGRTLVENWFDRMDFSGRTVLSTEVKKTFDLKVDGKIVPVTYIWDRCDERDDKTIEVIDYKTVGMPIQPDDLKKRIQPRIYALAAAIEFPGRPAYWVKYDLLRYDVVGAKFTRDDNVETYRYLQEAYRRISADDGNKENLNPDCRFCVRNNICPTLTTHAAAGGILRITDPHIAADQRAKLDYAKSAIAAQIRELDEYLLTWAEDEGVIEFRTDSTDVRITTSTRREVDLERAAHILGPDIMMKYGRLQMSDIDALLKDGGLDAETRSSLKSLIRKKHTAPSIKTKPIAVLGEDD